MWEYYKNCENVPASVMKNAICFLFVRTYYMELNTAYGQRSIIIIIIIFLPSVPSFPRAKNLC